MNSCRCAHCTVTKLRCELLQFWSPRTEISGYLSCRVADDTKLLLALLVEELAAFGSGTYPIMFCEIVLKRFFGMTMPGNRVRFPVAASTESGSKTWIGKRCPFCVVKDCVKSPPRSTAVGID